jgi:prevent-host-death family protein
MEVNVHHAKTNLSTLIAAAENGEDVIIARNGVAAVRLVPVQTAAKKSRREMWGAGIGKIWISPDFDSKETNDEIADMFENTKDFD